MSSSKELIGFDRSDSGRLGFAIGAVFDQAITLAEFRRWAEDVYVNSDSAPLFLLDLSEFTGPLSHIFRIIGFVPHWPFAEADKKALIGIAYLRNQASIDVQYSREECLSRLKSSSVVRQTFEKEFPFVPIPAP